MTLLLAVAIASGAVAWAVTRLLLAGAVQRLVDVPNERSSHGVPTPSGGGIAVVAVAAAAALAFGAATSDWSVVGPLLAGGLLVAGVSLADDLGSVPSPYRLLVHAAAAAIAVVGFGPWETIAIPGGPEVVLGHLAAPLTFLWIVGLTNAFNFMDGIDGIAGGQALVTGLSWALLALGPDRTDVVVLGAAIAGAASGFLMLNWSPAKIFLGDVGSAFLGYCFAVLPLAIVRADPAGPWLAGFFVAPFLVDSMLTFLRRAARRENLFKAHRHHFYQRLVDAGLPHGRVAALYTGLGVVGTYLGHAVRVGELALPEVIAIGAVLSLAVWTLVLHVERLKKTGTPESVPTS